MKEATLFSGHRFGLLCRKEVQEHGKLFLLSCLALYGLMVLFLVWPACSLYSLHYNTLDSLSYYLHRQGVHVFVSTFLLGGIISASWMMEGMRRKNSRIVWLMTPATALEKYLVRWFLFVFLYFPLCLLLFKLADSTRWLVTLVFYADQPQVGPMSLFCHLVSSPEQFGLFDSVSECVLAGSILCFIHSLFALGSILWTKSPILKTFGLSMLLFWSYVAFAAFLFSSWLGDHVDLTLPRFITGLEVEQVCWMLSALIWVFILLHWVLGYYRFKESEIINRW